jgi:DNA mismatch repair protein MutL
MFENNDKNKIRILPENIASKIAAGEVVQRPESVVKELMENSIDAGSTVIELIVKRAGKSLIQVVDNGMGMSEEDAVLSVAKHATSKIYTYEDLEGIITYGFRGEALSSMAVVSQLEIRTEMKNDEVGTFIRVDEPGIVHKEKGSFAKGTSVSVKNLFYNTPARRNFLKTDATELKHIIDIFNKLALSHPEINFKLFNDDHLVYDYRPANLEGRIKQVFADNMTDALIPLEERTDFINISGYIGKPTLLKKSKGEQYLFLNFRYVISRQINHAVFTAYEDFLEKGDYPFFILFLEIDPAKIDVNVHPSKLEVRFDNERDVYNFVLAVVKKNLGTYDLVPSMNFTGRDQHGDKISVDNFARVDRNDFGDRPFNREQKSYSSAIFSDADMDLVFGSLDKKGIPSGESGFISPLERENGNKEPLTLKVPEITKAEGDTFIIQLHNKYILSQIRTGLMIIDQHVAHERILYEKALKKIEANLPFSQQLLFPRTLETDPGRFGILKEIYPFLAKLGFELKFFSKNTVIIEGVPEDVKSGSEDQVLMQIIDEYVQNQREKKLEKTDNIAKSYSCRASIKAGDYLSEKEMRLLIDHLFATSNPYVCPHGRPIVVKISLDEFDRRFGRTS